MKATIISLVTMLVVVSLAGVAMIACESGGQSSSETSPQWYVGGTLNDKTVAEWRVASYRNRLATAADFVIALGRFQSLPSDFKQRAISLEVCISDSVEGGFADHWEVAETGATCGVLLGY